MQSLRGFGRFLRSTKRCRSQFTTAARHSRAGQQEGSTRIASKINVCTFCNGFSLPAGMNPTAPLRSALVVQLEKSFAHPTDGAESPGHVERRLRSEDKSALERNARILFLRRGKTSQSVSAMHRCDSV